VRGTVRVKPGSRQSRIEEAPDGTLLVWVKSPPVEGRANQELIERLAERFRIPCSQIRIRSGSAGRIKVVEIQEGGG